MLVFGTVIATRPHQVRIKIHEFDEFESSWYFVPQMCTVKDKSSNSLAINTEVAACVTDDFEDGCIIGALYNDEDVCILEDENVKLLSFEDGTIFKYDKTEHKHTVDVKGQIYVKATDKVIFDCEVEMTKNLKVAKDVFDKKGSMQAMRDVYNPHTHSNGNNGSPTGKPSAEMQ